MALNGRACNGRGPHDTYGRFPGGTDAIHLMWVMQAHHIDTDYYDRFFGLAPTDRRTRHTWRPGTGEVGAAMIEVSSGGDPPPLGVERPAAVLSA